MQLKTLLPLLLFFLSTNVFSDTKLDIPIGVVVPLSGNTALWGVEARKVASIFQEMEFEMYNFKFYLEDGKCGVGPEATTAAKFLMDTKKVEAIVAGCSGEVLQIAPLAEQQKVILMGVTSGNPLIKSAGEYVYRTYPDLSKGAELVAKYSKEKDIQKIAVLTEMNSFTVSVTKELKTSLGSRIILSEEFSPEETNYRSILLKARSLKPEAYYLSMASALSYQNIVKQIKQLGIKEQLFAYYNPGEKSSLENLKDLQEGVIYFDVPEIKNPTKEFSDFLEAYNKKYPEGPEQPFLTLTAYNAFRIITDMIVNTKNDSNKFRSYLNNTKHQTGVGVGEFDANGDLVGAEYVLKRIVGREGREM